METLAVATSPTAHAKGSRDDKSYAAVQYHSSRSPSRADETAHDYCSSRARHTDLGRIEERNSRRVYHASMANLKKPFETHEQ